MRNIFVSVRVENFKIIKSKVLPFAILASAFFSLMIGFLMYISLHPEIANSSSLIGAKASYFTETDWQSYFGVIIQMISAIGLVLFGFLTTWMFGREYSDRTLKDLLALPTTRSSIVLSKIIVVSFWSFIASLTLFVSSIFVGIVIKVNDWSNTLAIHVLYVYIITVVLVMAVSTPVALIASIGKGYLAPLAFIIITVMLAQFINLGAPGLDPYIPWAIPVIYSTSELMTTSTFPPLNILSYIILIGTCLVGILGTIYWWMYTDQF